MSARFLLFDLDGTLLDKDRTIRAASVKALRALMQHGVGVGLATGRMPKSARRYFRELRATGPCVCFNGAVVWDFEQERAIAAHHLERAVALSALALARPLGVHANLYFDDDIFIERKSEISLASAAKDGVEQLPVGPLDEWLAAREERPVKILFIGEPASLEELRGGIVAAHPDVSIVRSEHTYLELLPHGVNKAVGLASLCAHLGIAPTDVMAFGDNLNDVELLEAAGTGVALGNAHERLLAVADVVIGAHDTDAIAELLYERFAALLERDAAALQ